MVAQCLAAELLLLYIMYISVAERLSPFVLVTVHLPVKLFGSADPGNRAASLGMLEQSADIFLCCRTTTDIRLEAVVITNFEDSFGAESSKDASLIEPYDKYVLFFAVW